MSIAAAIAGAVARCGEPVVLRRPAEGLPDAVVPGKVRELDSDGLAGNVRQYTYQVIVAAETLTAAGWPAGGPEDGDIVVIAPTIVDGVWTGGGRQLTVVQPGYRGAGTGWWMTAKG